MTEGLEIVAKVRTDFPDKFGVPRQSGLADTLATVVFEPGFRDLRYLRGIEGYSHLWLLWLFSKAGRTERFSPTVRPPKLGGNIRMGVFATRSPFRPNRIGLSSVRLERVEADTPEGPLLHVVGADLIDGTPIIDIKPYVRYTDSHEDAVSGFAVDDAGFEVECPETLLERLPENRRGPLLSVLRQDPRPGYHNEPDRVYGFPYAGFDIRFTVDGTRLTVTEIVPVYQ